MTDDAVEGDVVDIIDGGDWSEGDPPPTPVETKRSVEDTRALLAVLMFALLAAVLAVMFAMLWCGAVTVDEFSKIASITITPVVGLVGAVSGYYYGRNSKD